jgi:nitrite reductase/ring-hydroxylating ferredoxin subunit
LSRATRRVDTDAILRDGAYFLLGDYALRDEVLARIRRVFLDGIESIEGAECRRRVEAAGLARMHEHFPVEKLLVFEAYLQKHLQRELYYWSYRVGRDDLGLAGTFYVDHLIVMRIHYPFMVARKAKNVVSPPFPLGEKLRLGFAALRNLPMLFNAIAKLGERKRQRSAYSAEKTHRNLPVPARAHGAHVDTWYGHSYDGINLWLSIDGVNEDNTVILYPEMFGYPVRYDPVSMYLAEGVPVTRPDKVVPKPGQLLVFNPELLHGTQLNISDETRVVLTTRLNPGTPRFEVNAAWNFEHWYSSDDLERRRFSTVTVFPAKKFRGEPSFAPRKEIPAVATPRAVRDARLDGAEARAACRSGDLPDGGRIAVDFENAKLMIFRRGAELRAFGRICPHLGMDMVGGYSDDAAFHCPGHGVTYSLADGSSRCEAFALRRYDAFERDGEVFVRRVAQEAG